MNDPKIFATAEFTKDMVETLKEYFETYAQNGLVTIEVTDHGLWIRNPKGGQQFLGSSTVFPKAKGRAIN